MSGRVLFLLENQPFPADRRVRAEAYDLAAAGYEVTVVSPIGPGADRLEADVDGVRALRYPLRLSQGGARGYLREYTDAALGLALIVRRLLREKPFDVVIAANPPDFLLEFARPLRRRGAGLIFDYHDPAPELFESMFGRRGPLYRGLLLLERRAQRTADVVMTVNEPCAELVRERGGVARENIFVVYNGPDPARFYPVEARPEVRCGREHLVLWVGQMSRKEGLGYLLEAADELINARGREDVAFAIVGDGPIRDSLQAEIVARGLAGAFSLPGHVGDAELRDYMSSASVCLSLDEPSELNDRSLMIKVLEYMMMGRPIVQFPLKEVRRVCGETTVYAASGDARDLARKIAELLDDPARRAALGQAAQARVRDGLTWQDQTPTLVAAVERAATIGRRRRLRRRAPRTGTVALLSGVRR